MKSNHPYTDKPYSSLALQSSSYEYPKTRTFNTDSSTQHGEEKRRSEDSYTRTQSSTSTDTTIGDSTRLRSTRYNGKKHKREKKEKKKTVVSISSPHGECRMPSRRILKIHCNAILVYKGREGSMQGKAKHGSRSERRSKHGFVECITQLTFKFRSV